MRRVMYNIKVYCLILFKSHERNGCMATNKVKITVGGVEYSIITDDDVAYVQDLAREVDSVLAKITKGNPRLSSTQAAVLAVLGFADECKKASADADRLREQIKDYLDDASNAKSKADKARHELETVKKQNEALKRENERLKSELDGVLGKVTAPKGKKKAAAHNGTDED